MFVYLPNDIMRNLGPGESASFEQCKSNRNGRINVSPGYRHGNNDTQHGSDSWIESLNWKTEEEEERIVIFDFAAHGENND